MDLILLSQSFRLVSKTSAQSSKRNHCLTFLSATDYCNEPAYICDWKFSVNTHLLTYCIKITSSTNLPQIKYLTKLVWTISINNHHQIWSCEFQYLKNYWALMKVDITKWSLLKLKFKHVFLGGVKPFFWKLTDQFILRSSFWVIIKNKLVSCVLLSRHLCV